MLEPQLLRRDLGSVKAALAKRGVEVDLARLEQLEGRRKEAQVATEELRTERNRRSKEIGQAKAAGEDAAPLLEQVASLGERLQVREAELEAAQGELDGILRGIPNIPHATVPAGNSEEDNEEMRRWGTPKQMDFAPQDHVALGEALGLLDFEAAARIAGPGSS